jgi:ribulose-5-phosphate 4-epimerase/fuculose-1-phosphate aldolase
MRNPQNANTYVVAPDVAPGAVTAADVVEREIANDETSTALSIYTEIYRARPDVNAILYARSPEIVAFTSGQARLRPVVNGAAFIGDGLPMFNLPALGSEQSSGGNPPRARAVVNALGDARAVLLAADGVVVTGRSIYNVVGQAYQLRQNAIIQRQAIQLGGQVTYLNQPPDAPIQELEAPARAAPQGGSLGPPEGRDWVYWAQNVSLD